MFVLQFPNSYPGHIVPNMYFLVHIISIHKGMSNTGRVRPQLTNQPISKDKIDPKPSNLVFGSIKPQSFVYKEEEEKPLGK